MLLTIKKVRSEYDIDTSAMRVEKRERHHLGGVREDFLEGVAFERCYVEMHVISTAKDREEVLRRRVCDLTQEEKHRTLLEISDELDFARAYECKSRVQGKKGWVPLCQDRRKDPQLWT